MNNDLADFCRKQRQHVTYLTFTARLRRQPYIAPDGLFFYHARKAGMNFATAMLAFRETIRISKWPTALPVRVTGVELTLFEASTTRPMGYAGSVPITRTFVDDLARSLKAGEATDRILTITRHPMIERRNLFGQSRRPSR